MPKKRQERTEEEPIGIVISRGSRAEPAPRFTAYVYAVAEETEPEAAIEVAAG